MAPERPKTNPINRLTMKKILSRNNEQVQETTLVSVIMAAIAVVSVLF